MAIIVGLGIVTTIRNGVKKVRKGASTAEGSGKRSDGSGYRLDIQIICFPQRDGAKTRDRDCHNSDFT